MKKAFSLLEVLVVMSIIGILIALGISGLIRLRENTEADQATNEVLSLLKEMQAKAKNNTIPSSHNSPDEFPKVSTRVYGYVLKTDGGIIKRKICWRNENGAWVLNNSNCIDLGPLLSDRFINISILNNQQFLNRPICNIISGIIFENLTGRIIDINDNNIRCAFAINIINQNTNYSFIELKDGNFQRIYE